MTLVLPLMVPSDGPCRTCKSFYGKTCCEFDPSALEIRFPMTCNEARRLIKARPEKSIEVRKVGIDEQAALDSLVDGRFCQLIETGLGFYLPLKDDGSCKFLGDRGCTLDRSDRPHICVMYPFDWGTSGWTTGRYVQREGKCFGCDLGGSDIRKTMAIFGVSPESLGHRRDQWLRDLKAHSEQMRKWTRK